MVLDVAQCLFLSCDAALGSLPTAFQVAILFVWILLFRLSLIGGRLMADVFCLRVTLSLRCIRAFFLSGRESRF